MWDYIEEELKYKTTCRDFSNTQYPDSIIPLPVISRAVSL